MRATFLKVEATEPRPPAAATLAVERIAIPPTTLHDLAMYFGWGNLSEARAFAFLCERETNLRLVQDVLETHKSDAPTALEALLDRIGKLKLEATRPPAAATQSDTELHLMADEPSNDDERDRYETPVLRVLQTFKKEAMPAMTEEEGGWLLGQILDIVEQARAAETLVAERARPPAAAVDPQQEQEQAMTDTYVEDGLLIILADDAWEVWCGADGENIINAHLIGSNPSREAAIAGAREELLELADRLGKHLPLTAPHVPTRRERCSPPSHASSSRLTTFSISTCRGAGSVRSATSRCQSRRCSCSPAPSACRETT